MPKRKSARRKPVKRKTVKRKVTKKKTVKRRAAPKRKAALRRRSGQAKRKTAKKRPAKRKTTRAVAKPRKASPARKAIMAKAVKKATIGKTVHYYDRIGVAIVELKAPLSVGDAVTFKRGENEHTQAITSMQIEHAPVMSAKKGDVVGVQVTKEVHEGAEVLPA